MKGAAHRMEGQARVFAETASHNASAASHAVTTKIRSNPVQASLIALGLGLVMGRLFRR